MVGLRNYELTDHLGNVHVVVSDLKMGLNSKVLSATEYYAFGMSMPGRNFSSGSYRFGFNGQEKDDEIYGEGNSYTAEFWQYDPRLGRRWNLDPVVKPDRSSYSCFSNNPIIMIDPNGDDDYFNAEGKLVKQTDTKTNNIYVMTSEGTFLLAEVPLNNATNIKTVANVVGHYSREIGHSGKAGISPNYSKPSSKTLAYETQKGIWVNAKGGINPLLSDFNNLKSTLAHEKFHTEEEEKADYKYSDHAKIYSKQISDETFKETSIDYKAKVTVSYVSFLTAAYNNEEINDDELIQMVSDYNELNTGVTIKGQIWGGGPVLNIEYQKDGKTYASGGIPAAEDPH